MLRFRTHGRHKDEQPGGDFDVPDPKDNLGSGGTLWPDGCPRARARPGVIAPLVLVAVITWPDGLITYQSCPWPCPLSWPGPLSPMKKYNGQPL